MQDNITVEKQMLSGTVEHVTFRNSATGFTVIELDCKGESITAVGVMPEISNGELLELTGYFDIHSTYGHQFKVDVCEHALPSGTAAILKYLSGGAIKGIGPSTAKRIVKEFGEKTFEILENQPDQLAMIKGITQKKAKQISEEFTLRSSIREVVLKLSQIGISGDEAIKK
ncbi:MAG: helix-hairpin-helix domain-containing protein [Oscillospiraceae bacterium]